MAGLYASTSKHNSPRKTVDGVVTEVKKFVEGNHPYHEDQIQNVTLDSGDTFTTKTKKYNFHVGDKVKVSFGAGKRTHFHSYTRVQKKKKEESPVDVWRRAANRALESWSEAKAALNGAETLGGEEFDHYGVHDEPKMLKRASKAILEVLENYDYQKTEGMDKSEMHEMVSSVLYGFAFMTGIKLRSYNNFIARAGYVYLTALRDLKEEGKVAEYQGRLYDNR